MKPLMNSSVSCANSKCVPRSTKTIHPSGTMSWDFKTHHSFSMSGLTDITYQGKRELAENNSLLRDLIIAAPDHRLYANNGKLSNNVQDCTAFGLLYASRATSNEMVLLIIGDYYVVGMRESHTAGYRLFEFDDTLDNLIKSTAIFEIAVTGNVDVQAIAAKAPTKKIFVSPYGDLLASVALLINPHRLSCGAINPKGTILLEQDALFEKEYNKELHNDEMGMLAQAVLEGHPFNAVRVIPNHPFYGRVLSREKLHPDPICILTPELYAEHFSHHSLAMRYAVHSGPVRVDVNSPLSDRLGHDATIIVPRSEDEHMIVFMRFYENYANDQIVYSHDPMKTNFGSDRVMVFDSRKCGVVDGKNFPALYNKAWRWK